MWILDCHKRLIELEKRLAMAENTNEHQNKVLQRNQKHLFLILAGLCLSLTLHFSVKSLQDSDKQFFYEVLRFLMGASGLSVVAKVSQMEKKA